VREVEATGLPLGLIPDVRYDDFQTELQPGETLVLYSDGMIEAHSQEREMFGNRRLETILEQYPIHEMRAEEIIQVILREMERFIGKKDNQEDDVTLVVLRRGSTNGKQPHITERRAPGD
jgi:serine phosphatase RsbU (regulator of sigma subunit)